MRKLFTIALAAVALLAGCDKINKLYKWMVVSPIIPIYE